MNGGTPYHMLGANPATWSPNLQNLKTTVHKTYKTINRVDDTMYYDNENGQNNIQAGLVINDKAGAVSNIGHFRDYDQINNKNGQMNIMIGVSSLGS